jgi:prophage antirepressor-like protein
VDLIVKEFNGNQVHTFIWKDKPCWIASEIVSLFGYADTSKTIQDCITAESFELGLEHDVLRGEGLKAFKEMVNHVTTLKVVSSKTPNLTIFYEDGLYGFLQYTDKPQGVEFRKWIRRDVVPEIRQTGGYIADKSASKIVEMTEYQKMIAKTSEENVKLRQAGLLLKIADRYDGTYRQVLESHATKIITGEHLLPLPEATQKTYSATEIGNVLGITGAMVGILANRHNLKTDEYGKLFHDKSRYSSKEVETFRYYENVIPVLKSLLNSSEVS